MTELSVIICTHDRVQLLRKAIESINRANRPEALNIDISVVANACSDETVSFLESYVNEQPSRGWLHLRYVEEQHLGKSYALNRGLREEQKPLIVFMDDDQCIDKTYFEAVDKAVFTYPDIGIFCGRLLPNWDGTEPAWIHDSGPYKIYPLPVTSFDKGDDVKTLSDQDEIPPGGILFVRRDVFKSVGMFSTEYGPRGHNLAGSEDTEFLLRCSEAGIHVKYIPDAIQYHHVNPRRLRLWHLLRNSYQRSRSITRLQAAQHSRLPLYMIRKVVTYFVKALCSVSRKRIRFYLVRLAAAAGEIHGIREGARLMTKTSTHDIA